MCICLVDEHTSSQKPNCKELHLTHMGSSSINGTGEKKNNQTTAGRTWFHVMNDCLVVIERM